MKCIQMCGASMPVRAEMIAGKRMPPGSQPAAVRPGDPQRQPQRLFARLRHAAGGERRGGVHRVPRPSHREERPGEERERDRVHHGVVDRHQLHEQSAVAVR